MRLLPAAALAVVLAVVPSCSSDDDTPSGSGSSSLPSDADLASYFGAVASYDVAKMQQAEPIAAEGSPAGDYLRYEQLYAGASAAGGNPLPSAEAEPTDGGYKACLDAGEGEECATWADLEGKDGRLTDFTVNGADVGANLLPLGDQPPITETGLFTAQPRYAYRSAPLHVLFVLVDLTASDIPLEVQPRSAIYVEVSTQLRGADSRGPTAVAPGEMQTVILAFPDADQAALDGQVTFDVSLGGRDRQPVGFGLTATPGA